MIFLEKWAKNDEKQHPEEEKVGQSRTQFGKIQKAFKIGLCGV